MIDKRLGVAPVPVCLLCDDRRAIRWRRALGRGYMAVTAGEIAAAMTHLAARRCRALVVDLAHPEALPLLAALAADHALAVPTIAVADVPPEEGPSAAAVLIGSDADQLGAALDHLVEGSAPDDAFAAMVTADPGMLSLFDYARAIAASAEPVLITGETGTGKDLMAQAIHRLSGRRGAFVPLNIAGFDDTLLSDALFGHRRGAFTGAAEPRAGMILRASGGTLFLDEVGDLSPVSQVKLLRLLQDGEYVPLGSDVPKYSSARVVVATSQDLNAARRDGRFRNDLFYRLRTHRLHLPPLRERRQDVPALFRHFVAEAARALGREVPAVGERALACLDQHDFPGNVRELRAIAFDAVSRAGDRLDQVPLALALAAPEAGPQRRVDPDSVQFPARLPTLDEVQHLLVQEALRRAAGNQSRAAALIGITRQAMNKRVQGMAAQARALGG